MHNATIVSIDAETTVAKLKHGNSLSTDSWERCAAILAEETGEVAEAILKYTGESKDTAAWRYLLRKELVQVASVAVRLIERLDTE